jgi:NitT/TauT family transport system substrate-binding protein
MARPCTRRRLIEAGAALIGGIASPAIGFPTILRAATVTRLKCVTLATGVSVIVDAYMQAKRFDLKNDVDLVAVNSYTSIANYYNDFAAGTFDVAIGSWDTFAQMYGRGIPIRLACTAASAELVSIVAAKNGPATIEELRGKTLAAVQASGSYKLSKMVIQDIWGIALEKDVPVENVPNPAQALTMIMADRAAAALSWEPSVSGAIARVPDMMPIFNLGAAYRQHRHGALPYFTYAIQSAVLKGRPDLAARVAKSFTDCIAEIMADPSEAIALAAPEMKIAPQALRIGFDSGRLQLKAEPMSNPATRRAVARAADYMHRNGGLADSVDDGFFAL